MKAIVVLLYMIQMVFIGLIVYLLCPDGVMSYSEDSNSAWSLKRNNGVMRLALMTAGGEKTR